VNHFQWRVPGENVPENTDTYNVDLRSHSKDQYDVTMFSCQTSNIHGTSPIASKSLTDLHVMACPSSGSFGVGIGIAVILIVVVICVVFVFYWRRMLCFADRDEDHGDYIDEEEYVRGTIKPEDERIDYNPAENSIRGDAV